MADRISDILGFPLPSSDPTFLSAVAIHIAFGLSAVVTGFAAMLSRKGRGRHSRFGTFYFWCLTGLFVTSSALAFARWSEDYHLFVLGALSFAAASLGRIAIRRNLHRLHLTAVASSYIVMLTAFYVDNGKNLPIWRDLPHVVYWIAPAAVGLPLTLYYLLRMPQVAEAPGAEAVTAE